MYLIRIHGYGCPGKHEDSSSAVAGAVVSAGLKGGSPKAIQDTKVRRLHLQGGEAGGAFTRNKEDEIMRLPV